MFIQYIIHTSSINYTATMQRTRSHHSDVTVPPVTSFPTQMTVGHGETSAADSQPTTSGAVQ